MTATQSRHIAQADFPIIIIGTGFSGIAMGIALKQAGIDSFTIYEKADDIGGTWRDNTYPGAACDVGSYLYSYSFEPKPDWTRTFSPQQEIQQYLKHCADKYGITGHIQFGCELTDAVFDEASGEWTVSIKKNGRKKKHQARSVILGNGALSTPQLPDIAGLKDFKGHMFHSARWNHDVNLAGKRVAVIGTGASAIQIIPQMQKIASRLEVFQRTPAWIMPKADRPMRALEQAVFKRAPQLQTLYRDAIYWRNELYATGFVVDPRLMKAGEFVANLYRKQQVKDPILRAKLTPAYTMGCKRTLLSNEYYPAMGAANVDVITTGIDRITERGIRTKDGVEHEFDAIVLATGFMTTDYLSKLNLVGRDGRNQNEVLAEKPEHYKGITVRGFPNAFLLMGPNTGLGHNSMVFMIEAQVRYVTQCIEAIRDRGLKFIDVKAPVQEAYTVRIQEKLQKSVWASGCQSWYLDKNGRNMAAWPGYTWQYWLETRRLSLSDFEQVPLPTPAPPSPPRAESPRQKSGPEP